MKLKKYLPQTIKAEARLYLDGKSLPVIAKALGIPLSTVSWHLIYPLRYIDHDLWLKVRKNLLKYAKNYRRFIDESDKIRRNE